jgi:hypothetical protein
VLQEVRIVIEAGKLVEKTRLTIREGRVVEHRRHPSDYPMSDGDGIQAIRYSI